MSLLVYLIALIASFLTLWRTTRMPLVSDFSYYIENAYRVFLGQIPYRDFLLVVSPGTYFIGGWLMKFFGRSYIYQVIYVMVVTFLTIVITYRILTLINSNKLLNLFLLLPIAFSGHAKYTFPSYDINLMLTALFCIYFILKQYYFKKESVYYYFFIGCLSVIPTLFKQNSGIAFMMLTLLFVILCTFLFRKENKTRKIFALLCGVLLVITVFMLYLFLSHSFDKYIYMTFVFPLKVRNINGSIYYFFYDALRPRSLLYYLPFVIGAILLVKKKLNNLLLVLLVTYGSLISPILYAIYLYFKYKSLQRDLTFIIGFTNLYTLSIWFLLYICIGYILIYEAINKNFSIRNGFNTLLLVFITSFSLSAFLLHRVEMATFSIYPLFAIMLLILSVKLKNIFHKYNFYLVTIVVSISTTFYLFMTLLSTDIINIASSVGIFDKSLSVVKEIQCGETAGSSRGTWSDKFKKMTSFVNSNIPSKDTIVSLPGEDPIYYITNRRPPLPYFQYLNTTFPYSPADYLKQINQNRVNWVIVKIDQQGEGLIGMDLYYIIKHLNNYDLIKKLDGYDIYKRKSD